MKIQHSNIFFISKTFLLQLPRLMLQTLNIKSLNWKVFDLWCQIGLSMCWGFRICDVESGGFRFKKELVFMCLIVLAGNFFWLDLLFLLEFWLDSDSKKSWYLCVWLFLLEFGWIDCSKEEEGWWGYFCPFPCHFANLMTWQWLLAAEGLNLMMPKLVRDILKDTNLAMVALNP